MEMHGECKRSNSTSEGARVENNSERGLRWASPRPGRKIAAEKRRIAREILREFYGSEQFCGLPRKIQLAIFLVCPREKTSLKKERLDVSA
jgi:hypothetical protein